MQMYGAAVMLVWMMVPQIVFLEGDQRRADGFCQGRLEDAAVIS